MSDQFVLDKEAAGIAVDHLLRAIDRIEHIRATQVTIGTSASPNHYHVSINSNASIESLVLKDQSYVKLIDWLASGPHARLKHINVSCVYSNQQQSSCQFHLASEGPYNQLTFTGEGNQRFAWSNALILDQLHGSYRSLDRQGTNPEQKEELDKVSALVAPVVQRFAESAAELHHVIKTGTKDLVEQFENNDRRLREKLDAERDRIRQEEQISKATIDDERRAAHVKFDEERERIRKEEQEALAKLKEDRDKFEAERKEYNDKKSTVVRRDLLEKLQKRLEDHGKKIALSPDTLSKSRPILWTCLSLAGLALIGAGFSLWIVLHDAEPKWHHMLPLTSSLLVLVTTAVFYIRWSDAIFTRHANLETQNQILHYDMLRASWFAEMLFEYKDDKQQPLPESVVQVMTKNLFTGLSGAEPARHPADDVAAFIKRINRVKVGEGEVEMEAAEKPRTS